MTPKASMVGVLAAIAAATGASFAVAATLLRLQRHPLHTHGDELGEATRKMKEMKAPGQIPAMANTDSSNLTLVKQIVVACDAGMGSSAMGASMLRKKVTRITSYNVCYTKLLRDPCPRHRRRAHHRC